MNFEEAVELLESIPDWIEVGITVHDWYKDWAQGQENQNKELRQSIANLLDQNEYEKALSPLQKMMQKVPKDKARSLYLAAYCYYKLRRRDEALEACEAAIQASTDENLVQDIYTLRAKIKFGFGFWIQWLVATVVVGAIGFFAVALSFGEQSDSSASFLAELLTLGVSIGFIQWLLIRVRITTGFLSLILNVVASLVSLTLSAVALSVNGWLGLPVFLGCAALFTALSIGGTTKQLKVTA